MPEPSSKPTRRTLIDAQGTGQIMTVWCNYCRTRRHYLPGDLARLLGNLTLDRATARMRCSECKRRDYLSYKVHVPSAADRAGMTIRVLSDIRTRKVPIWRDVVGG